MNETLIRNNADFIVCIRNLNKNTFVYVKYVYRKFFFDVETFSCKIPNNDSDIRKKP